MEELKEFQEEIDKRTEVENQAINLITQGAYKEAIELLNTLDDEKARKLLGETK